jgi:hypothetical protein
VGKRGDVGGWTLRCVRTQTKEADLERFML